MIQCRSNSSNTDVFNVGIRKDIKTLEDKVSLQSHVLDQYMKMSQLNGTFLQEECKFDSPWNSKSGKYVPLLAILDSKSNELEKNRDNSEEDMNSILDKVREVVNVSNELLNDSSKSQILNSSSNITFKEFSNQLHLNKRLMEKKNHLYIQFRKVKLEKETIRKCLFERRLRIRHHYRRYLDCIKIIETREKRIKMIETEIQNEEERISTLSFENLVVDEEVENLKISLEGILSEKQRLKNTKNILSNWENEMCLVMERKIEEMSSLSKKVEEVKKRVDSVFLKFSRMRNHCEESRKQAEIWRSKERCEIVDGLFTDIRKNRKRLQKMKLKNTLEDINSRKDFIAEKTRLVETIKFIDREIKFLESNTNNSFIQEQQGIRRVLYDDDDDWNSSPLTLARIDEENEDLIKEIEELKIRQKRKMKNLEITKSRIRILEEYQKEEDRENIPQKIIRKNNKLPDFDNIHISIRKYEDDNKKNVKNRKKESEELDKKIFNLKFQVMKEYTEMEFNRRLIEEKIGMKFENQKYTHDDTCTRTTPQKKKKEKEEEEEEFLKKEIVSLQKEYLQFSKERRVQSDLFQEDFEKEKYFRKLFSREKKRFVERKNASSDLIIQLDELEKEVEEMEIELLRKKREGERINMMSDEDTDDE